MGQAGSQVLSEIEQNSNCESESVERMSRRLMFHSLGAGNTEIEEEVYEIGPRRVRLHRQGRVFADSCDRQQSIGAANDCHF